jgi:hypothetical protein
LLKAAATMNRRILIISGIFVSTAVALGALQLQCGCTHRTRSGDRWVSVNAPPPSGRGAVDAIIVSDTPHWLAAVAGAASTRLSGARPMWVSAEHPSDEARQLIRRARPGHALFIADSKTGTKELRRGIEHIPGTELAVLPRDPTAAGVSIATTLWRKSTTVVMADPTDAIASILGGTLAAHRRVPLIPARDLAAVRRAWPELARLGVERVIIAGNGAPPKWRKAIPVKIEVLDRGGLEGAIIEAIGAARVRNVVVARTPGKDDIGATAWLAPYLASVRKSAVLLVDTHDPAVVEKSVRGRLRALGLAPRTITLLADYNAISMHEMAITFGPGEGSKVDELSVEPFTRPQDHAASSAGVGRIPFDNLEDSSTLLVRGFLRDRLLDEARLEARTLMVGNVVSSPTSRGLPLGETISRLTVAELENAGIKVDAFFRRQPTDPAPLAALPRATLVLYEGHINHQVLFGNPPRDSGDTEEIEEPTTDDNGLLPGTGESVSLSVSGIRNDPRWARQTRPSSPPGAPALEGLPLVVLQACNSLEAEMTTDIYRRGGVGVIGSVSNVHSASGAAFVKALVHGPVDRGETVGEALRDARNFFFLLQDLKSARNHKEKAQSLRAALSFRLWGDPEVRIFSRRSHRPRRRKLLKARVKDGAVVLRAPRRRLPESRTPKYYARIFSGEMLAGIVKRRKNREERRLSPLRYVRLKAPPSLTGTTGYVGTDDAKEGDRRGVYRVDDSGRYVYVLHFPRQTRAGTSTTLHFRR